MSLMYSESGIKWSNHKYCPACTCFKTSGETVMPRVFSTCRKHIQSICTADNRQTKSNQNAILFLHERLRNLAQRLVRCAENTQLTTVALRFLHQLMRWQKNAGLLPKSMIIMPWNWTTCFTTASRFCTTAGAISATQKKNERAWHKSNKRKLHGTQKRWGARETIGQCLMVQR